MTPRTLDIEPDPRETAPVEVRTRPPREHRAARRSPRHSHTRVRMLYFGLSSVWGFLAGSVAVLVAFDAVGHPITLRGELGTALSIAAVLAVVGGVIVSMAYRELAGRR